MSSIITLDHKIFYFINHQWTTSLFDHLMPYITDFRNTWWILLLSCAVWIFLRPRQALKIILGAALAVVLADNLNSKFIKILVKRDRPQNGIAMQSPRLLTHNHSGYSFASSHAANVFAAATFIFLATPWSGWILFPMALLVSYSRIYVGVHFPLDVLAGALIGVFCALTVDGFFSVLKKYRNNF